MPPSPTAALLERTPTGLDVTDSGRLFIRNIAMCFDAKPTPAGERQYSKTI
jgi:coproporphyrinogen III oxidase-like Fe-S oxidoreductase